MPEFLAHASDTAKKDYVDIATNDNIVKATKEKVELFHSIRFTILSLGSSCMGSTQWRTSSGASYFIDKQIQ